MNAHTPNPGDRIAVVGGGPSGIVVAKELLEVGFRAVVFEQSTQLGGQWNVGAPHSGVWPGMRANTSGTMTRFSEVPAPGRWSLFPRAEDVREYLAQYAEQFGVSERARLGARVLEARPADGGWDLDLNDLAGGTNWSEHFAGVVSCSGRFASPYIPDGLGGHVERVEVIHAMTYRGRAPFRGRRVLVLGNSISGLEIASDLALDLSITVTSACRRPRWIIPKLARGIAADQQWFTAYADLLGRLLAPQDLAAGLRAALLAEAGDPAAVGGLTPDPDLLGTGIGQAQFYLPLVAEGRIAVRPWIAEIRDDTVEFRDGSTCEIDAVIASTGYKPSLPYLAQTAGELALQTFDPSQPRLALMGQYVLHGPYLPVLELQARWIAGVWSGRRQISDAPMIPDLPFYPHHMLAGAFGAAAGAVPDPAIHPNLADALTFGPMLPERYRLQDPNATARFAAATADFIAPPDQVEVLAELTSERPAMAG
jgi:cation diffusion facilitator CzcD-associated flavoprotein CzcO